MCSKREKMPPCSHKCYVLGRTESKRRTLFHYMRTTVEYVLHYIHFNHEKSATQLAAQPQVADACGDSDSYHRDTAVGSTHISHFSLPARAFVR